MRWRPRHGGEQREVLAQRVIDCTGLATDYTRFEDPLIRQLLGDGLARPAPLRLGIDCTSLGAVVDRDGQPSRSLFAVGPITRGALWEIIAVPEIRAQAEQVATTVLTAARGRLRPRRLSGRLEHARERADSLSRMKVICMFTWYSAIRPPSSLTR